MHLGASAPKEKRHEATRYRRTEAREGYSLQQTPLWRLIRAGKFPRPIRLGENRIAFPEHEIDAWLDTKVMERDTKEAPHAVTF